MKFLGVLALLSLAVCAFGQSASERLQAYALDNDIEQMLLALKDGADVNWDEGPGRQTPIMAASLAGSLDAVKLLLKQPGLNMLVPEKDGYTPLHGAAFQGWAEVAKVLMEAGLDPNDKHEDGFTPIHRACWGRDSKHMETIKAFVEVGGVDVNQVCNGMTPLDSAYMNANQWAIDYLERNGGKRIDPDGTAARAWQEEEMASTRKKARVKQAVFTEEEEEAQQPPAERALEPEDIAEALAAEQEAAQGAEA